jgi:aryl-alcohol dehydrogenase-like predicted oxidoreductase
VLVKVAAGRVVPPAQVALAWLLARPGVSSVIVGARSEEQISQTLPSADLVLEPEEVKQLNEVSASPLPYPLWHQAKTVADRLSPADRVLL